LHINDQNSPLTETEAQQLTEIIAKLTPEQRAWVGQYLVENSNNTTIPSSNEATESSHITNSPDEADKPRSITILYGTETGNAQTVAETLNERLVENGFTVTISEMDDYKFDTLAQSEDLFLISSTHGEGEPPISAISFYEFLYSEQAPNLADVRYSVLALGDESFEFFCQAGKDFDERVAELGATRLVERVDCDFDYEESAESWMQQVLSAVGDQDDNRVAATDSTESVLSMKERKYSKSNPYYAEVLENINLNGEGSNKEVRHIELLLDNYGEGFEYLAQFRIH
jgi:sulfite reductase (NADPH) flavoprotein alpha-component